MAIKKEKRLNNSFVLSHRHIHLLEKKTKPTKKEKKRKKREANTDA